MLQAKTGKASVNDSLSKKEFIQSLISKADTSLLILGKKYLIKETSKVEPSKINIAMIHRAMTDEARISSMQALAPTRTYEIVKVSSDLNKDNLVGGQPLLDWNSPTALKRIDVRGNTTNLIEVSANFAALSYKDRVDFITANIPIVVVEYLLVSDYAILGVYM